MNRTVYMTDHNTKANFPVGYVTEEGNLVRVLPDGREKTIGRVSGSGREHCIAEVFSGTGAGTVPAGFVADDGYVIDLRYFPADVSDRHYHSVGQIANKSVWDTNMVTWTTSEIHRMGTVDEYSSWKRNYLVAGALGAVLLVFKHEIESEIEIDSMKTGKEEPDDPFAEPEDISVAELEERHFVKVSEKAVSLKAHETLTRYETALYNSHFGSAVSVSALCSCYLYGNSMPGYEDVKKNPVIRKFYAVKLKKMAENGDFQAMAERSLATKRLISQRIADETEEEYREESSRYLEKIQNAVGAGDPDAMAALSRLLLMKGEAEEEKAFDLAVRAAEKGNGTAAYLLYSYENSLKYIDADERFRRIRDCARSDAPDSCQAAFAYAALIEEKDPAEAKNFYLTAGRGGFAKGFEKAAVIG